jgi:hypothetical protein
LCLRKPGRTGSGAVDGECVVSPVGQDAGMRRLIALAAAASATVLLTTAAPASAATGTGEWVPAPSGPFDQAAGVTCDFPVHGEPIVDEVKKMVLASYPDGSPKQEIYTGALIIRVTNTATGGSVDADASGSAVIDYKPGGSFAMSSTWHVSGPVLVGFREGGGNLPRGLYILDGIYTIKFSDTGFKTVKMSAGTADNLCDDL